MFYIIHHNDADGRCAAAIVFNNHPNAAEVKCIKADYAMLKTQWLEDLVSSIEDRYDTVDHINKVYILDFSLPEEAIKRLECVTEVIWIDHHASAKHYSYHHLNGLRDFTNKGPSACELTWKFINPSELMPDIIKLIGDYDSWRLSFEERCKPLIVALESYHFPPDHPIWITYFNNNSIINDLINHGTIMTIYRDGYASALRNSFGFATEFEGLKCYALNCARMGSMAFGTKMQEYDACLMFVYDGNNFTVSMYSEKPEVDCSVICKKHGGGGHKGAAGFTSKILPFGDSPMLKAK